MHLIAAGLVIPAALAAQTRTAQTAMSGRPAAITVTPNERTQMLAFERGLKVVGVSTDEHGCKVVTLQAVPAPQHAQFATGVAGTVVRYGVRAAYDAGQPTPSQQTLMAAGNCGSGSPVTTGPRGRGVTVWPLGGYPRNGRMWRQCQSPPCAVYPPPTSWGTLDTYMDATATTPFPIRISSTPGLGRVLVRLYAFAVSVGNGKPVIAPIDSTNTVTVTY
ncbi:MAG TPA: hypothetical protein VMV51_10240 [Gemmatimonadaceae bacterium]|nr:hypothetical protein [Gemmatimonadaceae bacterium]